eukprot:scaffold7272_cov124-Skeletonema_dohrnii-CCMP3373.AAC.4
MIYCSVYPLASRTFQVMLGDARTTVYGRPMNRHSIDTPSRELEWNSGEPLILIMHSHVAHTYQGGFLIVNNPMVTRNTPSAYICEGAASCKTCNTIGHTTGHTTDDHKCRVDSYGSWQDKEPAAMHRYVLILKQRKRLQLLYMIAEYKWSRYKRYRFDNSRCEESTMQRCYRASFSAKQLLRRSNQHSSGEALALGVEEGYGLGLDYRMDPIDRHGHSKVNYCGWKSRPQPGLVDRRANFAEFNDTRQSLRHDAAVRKTAIMNTSSTDAKSWRCSGSSSSIRIFAGMMNYRRNQCVALADSLVNNTKLII